MSARETADLLFTGGPVLTMEGQVAEALAVRGNRILAVGDRADVERHRGEDTRVVDLAGRPLLPGFVDAHTHFVQSGVRMMRLNLANVTSHDECLQAVRERAKMTPEGGWVVGHSWDESKWREGPRPTREDLDRATSKHPVLLSRVDRHLGVLNTKGLEAAGFDPAAYPDGVLTEDDYYKAADAVLPALETTIQGIRRMTRLAWHEGVTSVQIISSLDDHRALEAAREQGALGVRAAVYFHLGAVDTALGQGWKRGDAAAGAEDRLRVNGIKFYADGSIGSRTAAVTKPYVDDPEGKENRGLFTFQDDVLFNYAKRVHDGGLQLAIHAIGDAAIEQALNAIAQATDGKDTGARHRIEHLELFTDAQAKQCAELGVVASVQPNFVGEWGHAGQMYAQRLGDDVVPRHNRFPRLLADGVRLAFGSDDMPFGPLYGVHCAVNGPTPEQSLDVMDALRAYTLGAAEAGFMEDIVGSLAPGKRADLVVLSADPRNAPDRISDLHVAMTVADGRVVHEA